MLRRYCNNVILLFRDIDRDAEIKALPAEQAEYVDFTPFGYYIFNMRKADNLRKSSKEKLLTVLNAWTKDYFILLARRN